jgi:hypothetical protein
MCASRPGCQSASFGVGSPGTRQIDEILLRRLPLGAVGAAPLVDEFFGRHGARVSRIPSGLISGLTRLPTPRIKSGAGFFGVML